MDYVLTECRRGGFNAVVETDYDQLLDRIKQQDVEVLSETPHLAVIRFQGEKISIKPGKLVIKVDDRDTADSLAEQLLR
jgi:hypothetical protein